MSLTCSICVCTRRLILALYSIDSVSTNGPVMRLAKICLMRFLTCLPFFVRQTWPLYYRNDGW